MADIFRYELRRLVRNKLFFGLLAVLLWYGWQLLNGAVILGVAHTAPFSPWTFGDYTARALPLLTLALLFFLWSQNSGRARAVRTLTDATPVRPGRYLLVRCCAAAAAWLLLALCYVLLGAIFLLRLFGDAVSLPSLALPVLAALLPPLVLLLGLGTWAGLYRPMLSFVPLLPALALNLLPLPRGFSLFGLEFFAAYPLQLNTLDPAFSLPPAAASIRLLYAALGIVFLLLSLRRARGPRQHAA